jgi:phospholipid-binding lipoprotein MlaA
VLRSSAAIVVLALAGGGCASTPSADPRDPLEPMNRAIFSFNDGLDEAIVRPVATVYHDHVHAEIRVRVRNFFSNIGDVFIGVNDILQGNFLHGFEDEMRVVFNTTLGLFGLHDVASDMGIEKRKADFGQTFGRWGVGDGPYLVLPILGPSTVRDSAGWALDIYTDPLLDVRPNALRNSTYALRFTSVRADLLGASRLLEEAALDKYVFEREAYLQYRRNLIRNAEREEERESD